MNRRQNQHIMRASILITAVLFATVLYGVGRENEVLRVTDKKVISFDRMIQEVKKSEITFIGEIHNSREDHQAQLSIIKAFHESETPLVIGFEMFRSDSNQSLEAWIKGTLPQEKFLSSYAENWGQPWELYQDIFQYAREHRIMAIGLNLPQDIARTVSQEGFAALKQDQRERLPPDISCNVDPVYMEFIKKAYAGHNLGNSRQFLNFCEAQMVWDKVMAWNIVEFIKKHPGGKVIVLCGVGHAWKRGIPEQVARLSKFTSTVIMPIVPGQVEQETINGKDADYVLLR